MLEQTQEGREDDFKSIQEATEYEVKVKAAIAEGRELLLKEYDAFTDGNWEDEKEDGGCTTSLGWIEGFIQYCNDETPFKPE